MSEFNPTDPLFQQAFRDFSPEVPEGVWEKIALEQERKRRFGGLWWRKHLFTIMILALLTAGGWWWSNKLKENGSLALTSPSASSNSAAASSDQPQLKENPEAPTAASSQLNAERKNTTTDKDGNGAIAIPTINSKQPIATKPHKGENAGGNGSSSQQQATLGTDPFHQNAPFTALNRKNNLRQKKRNRAGKMTAQLDAPAQDQFTTDQGADAAPLDTVVNSISNSNFNTASQLSFHPLLITSLDNRISADQPKVIPFFLHLPGCPVADPDGIGNRNYLEAYAGPDFIISSISDTAQSQYLENRKASSSLQLSFSAGARFTHVYNNGISIRTGINFSQINEKFSYASANIVQTTYITDPVTGDTTGSFITRGTRYKTTYNRYRTIDVPILLGYETGVGRWKMNLNAGPVINLYSWQKGEVLDADNRPVDITTGNAKTIYQFRNNIGVGLMLAASFYYRLNNKFSLLAEPYFRYNLSPATSEDITLKLKYNTLGLRIGIRFDLP